ncbi:related to RAM1 - protein farnesyltransferase, beta subunit [Cephalotrichum gorgonifer]|uniref:Protein farnesyltransferase subunit beta n=1 Tax=Cephalotrichum gorgonifer TaxID=2041049 RepID=A0AAE8SXM0_9PEZI|nr:related to RAM1 - protein farnesyltransferase, beta subunit [Cephalotrichum gorgonifer]
MASQATSAATSTTASTAGDARGETRRGGVADHEPHVPLLFTSLPPIIDGLATPTSTIQDATVKEVLPYLGGAAGRLDYNDLGVPRLMREKHAAFLRKNLGALPAPYIGADASRPWILYWCLAGLALLGEDVSSYRPGLVETARTMQNRSGGFGGGHGQTSHLATTYAVVLALAVVGGEEAYEVIDRRAMWKWLCSLKQPGGGFQMAFGGEVDVRGAYCASVVISLLRLPLELSPDSPAWTPEGTTTLFTNLAEYVQLCQTFEGGISGQPNAEAHGAYAFCALGCLSILDAPHRSILRYLDVPRLVSWLSSRQYAPEGGFSGRTNKLVDGCYSHWVGGCWPLIEACLNGPEGGGAAALPAAKQSLYSREGLIRYIMCCCQDESKRGGLRDKPGKPSDAYHTCYVLSGLSSAQHRWTLDLEDPQTQVPGGLLKWNVSPCTEGEQVFGEGDRVLPVHPIYVIPQGKVDAITEYFGKKSGF